MKELKHDIEKFLRKKVFVSSFVNIVSSNFNPGFTHMIATVKQKLRLTEFRIFMSFVIIGLKTMMERISLSVVMEMQPTQLPRHTTEQTQ